MNDIHNSDDIVEFITESTAYLDSSEPVLAMLQVEAHGEKRDISADIAGVFRAFHSIKGVAGFLCFTNVQEVTHKAEETLDRVRTGKRLFDRELGAVLLEACDLLRKYLSNIATSGYDKGFESEKENVIARLKFYCDPISIVDASTSASKIHFTEASPNTGLLFDWLLDEALFSKFSKGAIVYVSDIEKNLISILDSPTNFSIYAASSKSLEKLRVNALTFGFGAAADLCFALERELKRPRPAGSSFDPIEISIYFDSCNLLKNLLESPIPEKAFLVKSQILLKELESQTLPLSSAQEISEAPIAKSKEILPQEISKTPPSTVPKNEIRVSLERLDKMVDLIEELGVVSTGVFSSAEISEEGSGLKQTASKLRKITEELQEITVSIRMVPLSTVFRKMIRLVGDVSSKLGKKVRLDIVGEQTELDKDAVEALQDPLVHILRNCVDHGIEMPQERTVAGKSDTGIIKLQAWHSGGEAWISISDDGRGISKEKVLSKAISQGLATVSENLSEKEIFAFLFYPGFSMAKAVTEFSGRGVGMDVVKKNIEGLKGRVDLDSTLGTGSCFTIRLPMANALTESMLVRVGSVKYVIRVASIRETFQPSLNAVTRLPNGDELVALRGHLYPVIRLYQRHGILDSETQLDKGLIMIVENRGKQSGLFVDEVLGKIQAVIKPPPNLLKSAMTLAGCSIIGTESDAVALALDINALEETSLAMSAP